MPLGNRQHDLRNQQLFESLVLAGLPFEGEHRDQQDAWQALAKNFHLIRRFVVRFRVCPLPDG